jgi:mono/diheme cytochrome c family protein
VKRRTLVTLAVAIVGVAAVASVLTSMSRSSAPPPAATRGQQLYLELCADCHGKEGRGSWRATLFLIRPGDLTDPKTIGGDTDRYLFAIIKNGGSPLGLPGMPGFPQLSDDDVKALIVYLRSLSRQRS